MARRLLVQLLVLGQLWLAVGASADAAPSDPPGADSSWASLKYFAAVIRDAVGGVLYEDAATAPQHLSAEEVAKRQADVLSYLEGKSPASLGLADLVEVYHLAGAPSVLHGLVGSGLDDPMNLRLGALRKQLHLLVLKDVAAQFRGRTARVGFNDFGSTQNSDDGVTVKTDFDFTLFPDHEADGVEPDELIRAYKEHFARRCRELGRGLSPDVFDIVPHRYTAMIPDWRAEQSMADFEFKLRRGLSQLRENSEAYFLEGAFIQQVMKRSAGSAKTFAWVDPDTGQLELVDAPTVRQYFYRPDIRRRYAFGGAVGNWHFWNAHPDDMLRAKYLLRNFDEGGALLNAKLRDYLTLSLSQREEAIRGLYGDPATNDQARMFGMALEAAAYMVRHERDGQAAVTAALQPFIEYQRGLFPPGKAPDEATLQGLAHQLYERHSQVLMVHNIVMASPARLQDWLAPPPLKRETLLVHPDGRVERRVTVEPPETRERLQKAAFLELRDALAIMPDDLVERVRQQNPRMAPEIDILLGVVRTQREMMDAEGEHPDRAIVKRMAAAREAFDAQGSLMRRLAVGVTALYSAAAEAEELVQDHVQEWMIRAVRQRAGAAWADRLSVMRQNSRGAGQQAPAEVFGPGRLPGEMLTPPADLSQPRWTGRINTANKVVNVLTAYQKAGEFDLGVARTAATEGLSYLPVIGTAIDFVNAAEHKRGAAVGVGIQGVSLAATWFVPFWGQTQLLCSTATGVVSLWGESTFRPLLREKLQLAYQGYVDAYEGGVLTTGRATRVESPRVHLLYPVDSQGELAVDERRAKFFDYLHPQVMAATRTLAGHGPADDPSGWVQAQSRVILDEITGYVDDWWNATGPFASYDENTVRRAMDEHYWTQETRQLLIQMLVEDYNVGMQAYVKAHSEVKEREYGDLWLVLRDLAMQEALLDREYEAYRSRGEIEQLGELVIGAALDDMPQVAPGLELSVSPRVQLDIDERGNEVPRVTGFAVHVEVIGSPTEDHPAPFGVRLESQGPQGSARLGEPAAATGPAPSAAIELAAAPEAGVASAPVTVTAILVDGRGQELARRSLDLQVDVSRDKTAADESGEAAPDLRDDLSRVSDLATEVEALAAQADAECREAAAEAKEAAGAADELERQAAALEQALTDLESQLAAVDDLLASIEKQHVEAERQATRLGEAAHRAEAIQQRACEFQEAAARARTPDERARLTAPPPASDLDAALAAGRAAMAGVKQAAAAASQAAASFQALASEGRGAGASVAAVPAGGTGVVGAGAVAAASADARRRANGARAAIAGIDALRDQATPVVQAARGLVAGEPVAASGQQALTEIEQLYARIEDARRRVAHCPDDATAALAEAERRAAELSGRLEEAEARRQALRQALTQREAQFARAEQLRTLVDYLVDLAGKYLQRLEMAVIAGRACLNAARDLGATPGPAADASPGTDDGRCARLDADLRAMGQAGDLTGFRALLAQAADCPFYVDAAAWVERQDRCLSLGDALDAAARARDLAQFRALLAQASDCEFYQVASADLAAIERDDRCNALGAQLTAAAQANDLGRFRALLSQAVDCDYYSQAAADLGQLEQAQRQQAMTDLLGGVVQTMEAIQRQRQGTAPLPRQAPMPAAGAMPSGPPAATGPQVSDAEKKALEDQINARYGDVWKQKWCNPGWSGCAIYPSGVRAALVEHFVWGARTPQDLQKARALFQCYDPCVMQDLPNDQARQQCERQCRISIYGEP